MQSADHRTQPTPLSKTEYVLDRLRREIDEGKIERGRPLRQLELSRRLGVSPTPVREALRLLEAEGRVAYSPNRGAVVADVDSRWISDLYLLRAEVESLATHLAVERMDEEGLAEVMWRYEQLEEPLTIDDTAELSLRNRKFHFAIYDQASRVISSHVAFLWRPIPAQVSSWKEEANAEIFQLQHKDLLDAIMARDAGRAAAVMRQHIETAAELRTSANVS